LLTFKTGGILNRISRWNIRRKIGRFRDIPTHVTEDEKIQLYRLVRQVRGAVYVEIGSYLGASACCLAQAIRDSRLPARLFCVDTWQNEGMTEGARDTYADFRTNTGRFGSIIVPCKGYSSDTAGTFDLEVDFAFFDGDHSLAGVSQDWELWSRKMKAGTVVAFHDYEWAEGVREVVDISVAPRTRDHGRLPNLWWGELS
jgi:predicted O-methyltransferase YrrM